MTLSLYSVLDIQHGFADKFKSLRLSKGLTQAGLAKRSGVSLGTLKRFESTGEVSLGTLLHLANSLDCLDDFHDFNGRMAASPPNTLDALLAPIVIPKRGRRN